MLHSPQYALDHNVDRLAEDHANVRPLARGMAPIEELVVEQPDTNLVFFDTAGTGLAAEKSASGRDRRDRDARRDLTPDRRSQETACRSS